MLYNILKSFAVLLCKIFFGIQAFGCENIPKRGGFILASNHASYLDPVVLGVASPRNLNFMARDNLFINPLFSWLIRSLGAFPIKRDSADRSALKEAIRRLRAGRVLVLFPEGTRRIDGIAHEPHPGVGFLVVKSGVAVIPAFIKGTDKALPKGAKFIRPNRVSVHFGRQISIERRKPYSKIAEEIMAQVNRLSCA